MRNLHVTNTDKFIQPYIKFINKYFDNNSHVFSVIINKENEKFSESYPNIKYIYNNFSLIKLMIDFYKYDRIYLHGLFNWKVILLLYSQPWLIKKCSWIIWGGDLYYYRRKKTSIKSKFYEHMRKKVIKNMGRLLPLVEGDYNLAKKW